jgi:hypothetical protein
VPLSNVLHNAAFVGGIFAKTSGFCDKGGK